MSGIYEAIPASPEDVEEFAATLTPEYLYCRVWHHHPEPHDVDVAKKGEVEKHPDAIWLAKLRCRNGCGVKWRVLVDATGEVLMRRPDYSNAPDYVLVGKGRINAEGNKILRRTYFQKRRPTRARRKSA